jgi:hypothetical protein
MLATAKATTTPLRTVVLSSVETGDFVKECDGKPTDLTGNFCVGYIMGAFDALSLNGRICVSGTGATTLSAVAGTRKYIADHPEQWSQGTIFIVRRALQSIFPCR